VIDAGSVTTLEDTIVFDPAVFSTPKTIQLTSPEIRLHAAAQGGTTLTIIGPGANLLTIRANDGSRIFVQAGGRTTSISGMTLTRGRGPGGNAIANAGTIKATDMVFTDNVTVGNGGAISGGVIELLRCEFADNQANLGGAIYVAAAKITDCRFIRNTSTGGGGAIYAFSSVAGVMEIINTLIAENSAGSSGNSDGGGAIYVSGDVTLRNSIVRNNTATLGTSGGAIVNENKLTLIDTLVTQNSATGPYGGAIYHGATDNNANHLRITNSTISHNEVNAARGNRGRGGAIYISGGNNTTITGSVIHENHVRITATPTDTTESDGGAIYMSASSGLTMDRCTISLNTAGLDFGGIRFPHSSSYTPVVTNSTIVSNTAGRSGGGIGKESCTLSCTSFSLGNTIVGRNNAPLAPDIKTGNGSRDAAITSLGHNLIERTEGGLFAFAPTDILGLNPLLGPLQANGGATLTHAPLADSPVIDRGKRLSQATTDQVGKARPLDAPAVPNPEGGDGTDIGAFELEPSPNTRVGNNVTVPAPMGNARLNYANNQRLGFTSWSYPTGAGGNASEGLQPPDGYQIVPDAPAYEINTTADYDWPLTVCFAVNSINNEAEFSRLRILHGEDGQLVDRTAGRPDFATRTVCAQVTSLSPFYTALAPKATPLPAPQVVSAVSRKMHGATPYDIPLPLQDGRGVESRSGGAEGNYQIVATFDAPVDVDSFAVVSADSLANANVTAEGAVVTINLSGVTNAQTLWVALAGVDNGTTTGDTYIPMAVLTGDVNGNGTVNATDIAITKSRSGAPVDATNFRSDVVANGSINATDIGFVKSRSGSVLPQ
jgi:predicted outer membrane repeat protein